jgi:hypothetical protein
VFARFAGTPFALDIGCVTETGFALALTFVGGRRTGVPLVVTSEFAAEDVELQPKLTANNKNAVINSNTRNIILNNLFCF